MVDRSKNGASTSEDYRLIDLIKFPQERFASIFSLPIDIINYLLQKSLLNNADMDNPEFKVFATVRRNQIFKVCLPDKRGLFIKIGMTPSAETLAHEARTVAELSGRGLPCTYVPELRHADFENRVFVYRLIPDAQTLWQLILNREGISHTVFRALGRAIAQYSTDKQLSTSTRAPIQLALPFYFDAPPASSYPNFSQATVDFLKIVQSSPTLLCLIQTSAAMWEVSGLIHFDLRLDNILVERDANRARLSKIVDWEFAVPGDPLWDICTVIAEIIGIWIASVSGSNRDSLPNAATKTMRQPDSVLRLAAHVTEAVLHGMNRVTSYDLGEEKFPRFVVLRLLQICYERSFRTNQLTKDMVLILQFCENLANRPRDLFRLLQLA